MPKHAIRELMLAKRRHCSAETCLALSLEIQQRFLASAFFRGAGCLALYSPICNEVMTEEIARQAVAEGKRLVYPRVLVARLEFVEVSCPADLKAGAYGILEPTGSHVVPIDEIELFLVPGIAFDRTGHRLGFGKGYYDRVLDNCDDQALQVGLAYDFQVLDTLPVQQHDRPVSVLVTESRILTFMTTAHAT